MGMGMSIRKMKRLAVLFPLPGSIVPLALPCASPQKQQQQQTIFTNAPLEALNLMVNA